MGSESIIDQILTTLHEAGHSFYEMGLPKEHYGMPLAEPISHAIHESESRCWETRIGRTMAFWHFFLPKLKKVSSLTEEELFRAISRVKPTFIRTESDEITYPLHVILRFEIEKELLTGKLQTKELSERWRAGMKTLLGIEPPTDRQGCLQDIHWSMGAFGYFPTYTLGNVIAAQLFEVFEQEYPNWQEKVKKGQFEFIKEWHLENVHQHGRRYSSKELVEKISGKKLSSQPYTSYLTTKYQAIFP